jgi:hypothetical protein
VAGRLCHAWRGRALPAQNSLNDLEFAEGESKFKSPKNLIWASGFLIGGPPSPGSETIR